MKDYNMVYNNLMSKIKIREDMDNMDGNSDVINLI